MKIHVSQNVVDRIFEEGKIHSPGATKESLRSFQAKAIKLDYEGGDLDIEINDEFLIELVVFYSVAGRFIAPLVKELFRLLTVADQGVKDILRKWDV